MRVEEPMKAERMFVLAERLFFSKVVRHERTFMFAERCSVPVLKKMIKTMAQDRAEHEAFSRVENGGEK